MKEAKIEVQKDGNISQAEEERGLGSDLNIDI